MAAPKIIADFETQLSTAIAVGGTSFSLASVTDDDGVSLPSGLYYFTIDNGTSAKEYLSGSLSGSEVTSVVSVSRQGVETSGAARAHRVGASVMITDFATYKKYMDDLAISGATDASTTAKGIVEEATQAEVLAKTATGATTARLFVNPSTLASTLLSDYKADTGAADAYAIAPSPAITAYTAGQVFFFKATNANTGSSTLNVNGLGVKTIKKYDGATNLASGDIKAGQLVLVQYDGTYFQMLSLLGTAPGSNVQAFTSSGTWTKPAGATNVRVILIGGGGGGGGGGSNSNSSKGGGGGSGGGYTDVSISASLLSATETVTIGTGGPGGAAQTAGTSGNPTTFGSHFKALGGNSGAGALTATVSGGSTVAGTSIGNPGGGSGESPTATGTGGGGGGGGANVGGNAGSGSSHLLITGLSGGSGGSSGNHGGAGTAVSANMPFGGAGGGGGGQGGGSNPGNGGAGGLYGGGGGGGGGADTGRTGGTGGAGADGFALVISS